MKIVRKPNRWLKKLSRAAALLTLAMSTQSAYSQDGAFSFGRTPAGSASEVIDSNRDGFGVSFRGGHMAGESVGRQESISHINLMPYFNIEDGLLFGDSRLVRANKGGLAWSFGGGYRHYITDWDVVIGGNGYFDRDQLTGATLNQWGAGAELLADRWEARGNYYQTFGNTFSLVGQGINQNSVAFSGSNITYTRVDTFAEALKGFDSEIGFLLPGNLAERFDLRAFGGGYFYEGENTKGFGGWSSRLQADIGKWLELGLKVTDDDRFRTTVSFTAAVHFGGFSSEEHTKRSAIQRFRDPVRRNMNIVALTTNIDAPGQLATRDDGVTPLTVAHVNSNAAGPGFSGSVADPYSLMTQGLSAGTDIVFVHAGSTFNAAPENIVSLLPGQRLIGEGLIVAGRPVETQIPVNILGQTFQLTLPDSPTFAAAPGLARPTLTGAAGNGVTMANDSWLSGFIIDSAAQNGIFSNGVDGTFINDTSVVNAGLSGILLQNTTGQTNIVNTSVTASTSADAAVRVDGGNGIINFTSSDDFFLASINNTSPNASLLIENMTGGRFSMNRSSITDDGGLGVVIRNNTGGAATIDNLSSVNSTGNGISITDSAGDYVFRKSRTSIAAITIQNPTQQGILIQNASGNVTFTDPVLIEGRQAGGLEISGSSGIIRFSDTLTIRDQAGAGTEAAIYIHDQLANSGVTFADTVTIGATSAALGNNGNGIFLENNAAGTINFQDNVFVNLTDLESILINNNSGDVNFLGVTTITNRLLEGISINGSSGTIQLGTASADRTEVQNELNSQNAAIEILGNSGTVRVSNAVVVNAQGNAGRGAGLDIWDNTGLVRIIDMDVESIGGVGLFGFNNFEISTDDGMIDTQGAAAVNIEESGINIHLEQVNSSGSPDYGIRLVETNRPQRHTFLLKPNVTNATPGSGGLITAAKGNLLDDNDSAGIYLENAGQVTVTDVILDNNEFGVRIENTETPGGTVLTADEQYFGLIDSLVIDSDIRAIHAQDLMQLEVTNTEFDNNGDDIDVGRETFLLQYSTTPDFDPSIIGEVAPTSYDRAGRPFEVLIQDSGIVSNAEDAIRITQSAATAQGAVIRTQFLRNSFQVNDTTDPTTANPIDTRPLFDDAITMDWFGAAQVFLDGNRMDMTSTADQQHAFDLANRSTLALTELSIQDNIITVNSLGNDNGVIIADLFGEASIGSSNGLFQIARNTIRMSGVTPTGIFLSMREVADVTFEGNNIRSETDGGTGIEIRRSATNSFFRFTDNNIEFRDLGGSDERGIIFTQVGGIVGVAGTGNFMSIISNGVNGNNFIEVPISIPPNAAVGAVTINGVLFTYP